MSPLSSEHRERLTALYERGVLTADQLAAVLSALDEPTSADRRRQRSDSVGIGLWEVLGYIGGALVFAGVTLLAALSWSELSHTARSAMMVLVSAVLVAAGLTVRGGLRPLGHAPSTPRTRVGSVLLALPSISVALAVQSAFGDHADWDVVGPVSMGSGLLVAAAGMVVTQGLPALLCSIGFSVGLVTSVVHIWFDDTTLPMTSSLIALGALWTVLAITEWLRFAEVALAGGVLVAMYGSQFAIQEDSPWAYGLTLAIALLCFAGYRWVRTPVLLALGVLGVTVAVPEAVWDITDGSLGGPLTVLLVGAVFLAASGLGFWLRKRAGDGNTAE